MNEYIEEGVLDMFDLPAYVKNKSFAEAADIINKKFKGREDRVAQETKLDMLERLADAQEFVKEMNEERMIAMDANAEEVPDMMDGEIPEGADEFMAPIPVGAPSGVPQTGMPQGGGQIQAPQMNIDTQDDMNNYNDPNVPMQGLRSGETPNMFLLGGLLEDGMFTDKASGLLGSGIDMLNLNTEPTISETGNIGHVDQTSAIGSGALQGASLGMQTGNPLIAAGGAVVGGVTGLIGAKKTNKKVNKANRNLDFAKNSQFSNTFNTGGPMDEEKKTFAGKSLDWLGSNYGDILKTAPIVRNLTTSENRAVTPRGTRLDNRYDPTYVDKNALTNEISGANINRAITEMSGGDVGVARANLLGASINRDRALSNAYLQADMANRQENQTAQQFNLGVDQINLQQDERFIERKAQDDAAFNTARSARKAAIAEDIGAFGKERSDEQIVRGMFGYTRKGKYWVNDKGERLTGSQYKRMINDLGSSQSFNFNVLGDLTKRHFSQLAESIRLREEAKKKSEQD